MTKTQLLDTLAAQEPSVLLDLLAAAYDKMTSKQREAVFGRYMPPAAPAPVDGEALLTEIELFQKESRAGYYYSPFAINSKNWHHIPKETRKWFKRLGKLLQASQQLTAQGDHLHAVTCFTVLFELIEAMENGEDIVFGDEIGSWMIPGEEKEQVAAYLASLAAVESPEGFTAVAVPLIRRDSWNSFYAQVYTTAVSLANESQRIHLEAEVQRQNIRTDASPRS